MHGTRRCARAPPLPARRRAEPRAVRIATPYSQGTVSGGVDSGQRATSQRFQPRVGRGSAGGDRRSSCSCRQDLLNHRVASAVIGRVPFRYRFSCSACGGRRPEPSLLTTSEITSTLPALSLCCLPAGSDDFGTDAPPHGGYRLAISPPYPYFRAAQPIEAVTTRTCLCPGLRIRRSVGRSGSPQAWLAESY